MPFDFAKLNEIADRVTQGEYHIFISMYRGASGTETVRVSLERGSTYGKFHMKVEGYGATPSEAFEAALRQFPPNPIDGVAQWDTQRLSPPVEDGVFNETT
jgi:hypothetical protein